MEATDKSGHEDGRAGQRRFSETVDLDSLGIELEAILFINEEFLNGFALITLKLNNLTHLGISHDSAIASELFLDDLQDLFAVEFSWQSLDCSQRLSAIALLDANMNIFLLLLRSLSGVFVGLGEGVIRLEVFDVGHKLWFMGLPTKEGFLE